MLACQSDLVSMSDSFNAACCSVRIVLLRGPRLARFLTLLVCGFTQDPANCAGGTPRNCDAGCAALWNPFCAFPLLYRAFEQALYPGWASFGHCAQV